MLPMLQLQKGQESTGPQLAEVGCDVKEQQYTCLSKPDYKSCLLCSPDVCITSTLPPLAMGFPVLKHRYNGQKYPMYLNELAFAVMVDRDGSFLTQLKM